LKFARLYLKAFGPFRDRVIELSAGRGRDLHVIFGPNEAGKSTVLRAVTAFLFGVPERTADAFLHDYASLRIGATVVLPDGTRLSAMRRKARKATLFPIEEATGTELTERPLPDGTATDLVGGLDLPLYQSLFGLDLEGLVRGSDELLRGEGDVGRSLFQAAAGLASLRNVIADLDEEAAATFKARGSTGRLNRALGHFDEHRRILKDATVRTYVWEAAEREHRQAEDKHGRLRDALKDKRAEQQRLQRIRSNLPLLAEREEKGKDVAGLAQVPLLTLEAGQLRAAAQERLRSAEEAKRKAEARLEQLKADAAALVLREGVLAHASSIEQAFHAIDSYRSARDALPQLARERAGLARAIGSLLAEIGSTCEVDQASRLLPPETLTARVQALVEERGRLQDRDEQLEAQIRAREAAVERVKGRVAAIPESLAMEELEASVASAAGVGELENRRRKLDSDIAEEEGKLQSEAAALWPGSLPDLLALTVPLSETADAFDGEFSALAQDERLVEEKAGGLARDLEERRRELQVLGAAGEVVTQAEVAAARAERDRRWADLRRAHIDVDPAQPAAASGGAPAGALAASVEAAIREADRLADLLRADTERATNLEAIRQRIEAMQDEMGRCVSRREALADRRQALQQRWDGLTAPLRRTDLTPAALREWLTRQQRVVERHGNLQRLKAERTSVDGDVARARVLLDSALRACGLPELTGEESGAGALARAQKAVSAARKAGAERDALTKQLRSEAEELRDLQSKRQRTTRQLGEWTRQWKEAAEAIRLTVEALPAEARTRLDQFSRLSKALADLTDRDASAAEHEAAVKAFEAKAAAIAQAVGQAAQEQGADVAAESMYRALGEARRADARRQQIESDMAREARAIDDEAAAAESARKLLEQMVRSAGCRVPEELPEIEERATRKQGLQQRLREIDEQLVQQNAKPVEEVVTEAAGSTLDGIARVIAEAEGEIEDLERKVDEAQLAAFTAKQCLDAIDGGTAAAEAQQAMRSIAAQIAKEARIYARARLAGAALARVMQAYREQHQGPLLKRAAEVFARITLGSFSGLTVDYEDERQVLLGVRSDATRVPVMGMSQGTRDQLFLSLRLAAIEQHIDGRGPFPVIVDDLLVQFDDDRAVATLEALAELSARTQVLFFTHHRHLVELVERSSVAAAVAVQSL
jgi:exonuclease SbcC